MKRLLILALLLFVGASTLQAQQNISASIPSTNVAADFTATSASRVPLIKPFPQSAPLFVSDALDSASPAPAVVETALSLPMEIGEPSAAAPDPEPKPRFIYSDRDDYRFQLGLGMSFERFRSSIYSASAIGTNTSLSYFLNDWLGVEGNVSTFFAPYDLERRAHQAGQLRRRSRESPGAGPAGSPGSTD